MVKVANKRSLYQFSKVTRDLVEDKGIARG